MKINNIALIILCLLLIPFNGMTQNEAEAEFETVEKTYTLNADGSQEQRVKKVVKLYTYNAMRSMYGESFIVYNPTYQSLKFNETYTIMKDGTKVNVPENAFVPVLPRFASKAPYFNDLVEMVVVHTGLELGATIYIDYTIETKAGILPELDVIDYPNEESPVKNYSLTINIPKDKELAFFYQGKEQLEKTTGEETKTYKLTLKNLPENIYMSNHSEQDLGHAPIQFSTYQKVEDALNKYAKLVLSNVDLSTQTYAEYLTNECSSDEEKLSKILNYVAYNIDQINVPLNLSSYKLRSMDDVRNSAYGTYEEKLAVLNGMLTATGFDPLLVIATKQHATGIEGIESVALKVAVDGVSYYLTPSQTRQSSIALMADNRNYYEYQNGAMTALQTNIKIVNHKSSYNIKISKKENSVKETRVIDQALCAPGEKNIKERNLSAQIKKQKDLSILYLPHNTYLNIKTLGKNRNCSFEISHPFKETQSYEVDVCNNYEIIKTTEPIEINTPIGSLKITCLQEENKLMITKDLDINRKIITPDNYPHLVSLINAWNRSLSEPIILKDK